MSGGLPAEQWGRVGVRFFDFSKIPICAKGIKRGFYQETKNILLPLWVEVVINGSNNKTAQINL